MFNAGEIESSVPPVPAVMSLLLLAAVNPLLRKLGKRWQFSRADLLIIYGVLVLTVAMSGRRMVRILLAFITAPRYYENLADIGQELPAWFSPDDTHAITVHASQAPIPTSPGMSGPALVAWTVFLVGSWVGIFCLLDLFRRRWADQEHLRFPLLYLPLELSVDSGEARRAFLRNGLMWTGFAIGFWYALPVVLSPIWPRFPDWKVTYYPFQALNATPWNELQRIYMRPLPHLIGFGYLMSTDNLFTIWASYLLQQLFWVGCTQYGYRRPGWNTGTEQQQSMGAILALAGMLLWANRHTLSPPQVHGLRRPRPLRRTPGCRQSTHPQYGRSWWLGSSSC